MEGIDLLAISPGQLEYVFAPNVDLKATLSLKNLLSDGRGVAFKVKTSAVNRWGAHPFVKAQIAAPLDHNLVSHRMIPATQMTDNLYSGMPA